MKIAYITTVFTSVWVGPCGDLGIDIQGPSIVWITRSYGFLKGSLRSSANTIFQSIRHSTFYVHYYFSFQTTNDYEWTNEWTFNLGDMSSNPAEIRIIFRFFVRKDKNKWKRDLFGKSISNSKYA